MWANLQRIVDKRGRTGKKRSPVFQENRGDSLSCNPVWHPP